MTAPLTPPECDLKEFPFTPIYRARLFGSAFHAKANDAEWRAGVTLWLKSQDQVPAGSLPNDDTELCRLAEYGRDLKTWLKVKTLALHGWFQCSDGRLYNNVVAQVVNDQWQAKLDQRNRTIKARVANLEKRLLQTTDEDSRSDIESQLQALRQRPSQGAEPPRSEPVTNPVTELVTASKRRDSDSEGKGHTSQPSRPTSHKNQEILDSSVSAGRNGNGKQNGATTIADPRERLARFQAKVAKRLGTKGWEIVASASDKQDPRHDENLALCKAAARDMDKGWPQLWT